jgi:hypothetical protein
LKSIEISGGSNVHQKIREICDQLGIDIPEVDTQVTSLSTTTQIIADECVLDHVEANLL